MSENNGRKIFEETVAKRQPLKCDHELAHVLTDSTGSERLAIKAVVDQALELVQTKCEWDFDEPIDYISDGKGDFKRPATWQEKELRSALLEIERIIQND